MEKTLINYRDALYIIKQILRLFGLPDGLREVKFSTAKGYGDKRMLGVYLDGGRIIIYQCPSENEGWLEVVLHELVHHILYLKGHKGIHDKKFREWCWKVADAVEEEFGIPVNGFSVIR